MEERDTCSQQEMLSGVWRPLSGFRAIVLCAVLVRWSRDITHVEAGAWGCLACPRGHSL